MSIFNLKSVIRIVCAKFTADYLVEEIKELGFEITQSNDTGIEIEGTLADCQKLNLYLRTAYRVIFLLDSFEAENPEMLYKNLSSLPWEDYIPDDGYISISSYVNNIYIRDSRFANLKVKDAVVDRIQEKRGTRPNSGPENLGTSLYLYWNESEASIFIDTSGDTIAKHNYRKIPLKAPMIEALATSIVKATRWDYNTPFINPMCGSGTLAIEAALLAINKAPGLLRDDFGFMHVRGYKDEIWEELKKEAVSQIRDFTGPKIIATDIDYKAIRAAEANAKLAGVSKYIEFKATPFEYTRLPKEGGIIVVNPPYGERLGEFDDLADLYARMGNWFKHKAGGYTAFVFTASSDLMKYIGLKPRKKIPFYNAKLECRLLEYELYEGSKKINPKGESSGL